MILCPEVFRSHRLARSQLSRPDGIGWQAEGTSTTNTLNIRAVVHVAGIDEQACVSRAFPAG